MGEPYFVPLYLPLLVFSTVVTGRIGGPPAATALASSTLLYMGVSGLHRAHISTPSTPLLVINAAACVLLVASSFLQSYHPREAYKVTEGSLRKKGVDHLPQPRPQLREGEGTADGLVLEDPRRSRSC